MIRKNNIMTRFGGTLCFIKANNAVKGRTILYPGYPFTLEQTMFL